MNKKLIAAAVSAVVVPVASHAQSSDVTVYGNVTNAIDMNSTGATSTTDISGVAARLGFRASSDLGNGLTGHGVYEFSTSADKEAGDRSNTSARLGGGIEDTRVATVGLSGAFGRIDVGNQWSGYFNTFGTLVSPTYSLGYYLYSSVGAGAVRASNTIKYANDFGPLHAELDIRFNDSNEGAAIAEGRRGEGVGLGLSFAVTDSITVAAAFDSDDRGSGTADSDLTGFAVRGTFGGFWGTAGLQSSEDTSEVNTTFLNGGGSIGENTTWLLGLSQADDGDLATRSADSSQTYWSVNHRLGGGMRLFYEGTDVDIQNIVGPVSGNVHLLGMRINF